MSKRKFKVSKTVIADGGKRPEGKLRYYCFSQNNSGGRFTHNDTVGDYVIIQASSADEANNLAVIKTSIYFDDEADCPCCGSRWSEQWSDDNGTDTPSIYDTPVENHEPFMWEQIVYVYHYDGRKEKYEFKLDPKNTEEKTSSKPTPKKTRTKRSK